MNKKIAGTSLFIVTGIGAAILGTLVGSDDYELLVVADPGTTIHEVGKIIVAVAPGAKWGRCDDPKTQEDIDYCKGLGTGLIYTVRTVDFVTEAEANSINAGMLKVKVNDTEAPSSLVTIP